VEDVRNKRKIIYEQPPRESSSIGKILSMYNREKDIFVTTRGNLSREVMKKLIPDVVRHLEMKYPELKTV